MQPSIAGRSVLFKYQDGLDLRDIEIDLPESKAVDLDSCYLFAFHKSGSGLANAVVREIMRAADVPVVSLSEILFSNGISETAVLGDLRSFFVPKGYCFAGFRGILPCMVGAADLLSGRKVLLVRDPRDMLVSMYYSFKYSHPFPSDRTAAFASNLSSTQLHLTKNLDEFCIAGSGACNREFHQFIEFINVGNIEIIRYEDIIYDKLQLVKRLCGAFNTPLPDGKMQEIADIFDSIPNCERQSEHIRQVHPGDHRRKLQSQTIEVLDKVMKDFIRMFDYSA